MDPNDDPPQVAPLAEPDPAAADQAWDVEQEGDDEETVGLNDAEAFFHTAVNGLRFLSHELGMKLLMDTSTIPFSAALRKPGRREDAHGQVVYGAKWCGHRHNNQIRQVILMGDRRQLGQMSREPGLMTLS